jgi:catechol 2,3-dioxygenase-like lactoylglutathione lyase family enzyme
MAIQRMDNVLIVVEDLEAAKAFFAELGMELEGETQVEGPWVGQVVGLDDVRADIAMMRTPDGHGRVELTRFHTPLAVRAESENAPANALVVLECADSGSETHRATWPNSTVLDEMPEQHRCLLSTSVG